MPARVELDENVRVGIAHNREPLHIREFMMQIRSKKINDFGTPAFILLAVQNVSTNAPIENDHLGINGESRASLG